MRLEGLTPLESAYLQTKFEMTGIHYALDSDGVLEVLAPTLAQRLYIEGAIVVMLAEQQMRLETEEASKQ